MDSKTYIAIDLKSFYASVECVERGLDPLQCNLVVADPGRTEKTICLAVSPSLKAYGISGRARLFEVVQKVSLINEERLALTESHRFSGKSFMDPELKKDKTLELDYIVAPPRMKTYMDVSTRVYETYLKYVSPEDIHVYSVDEVFIDATSYLKTLKTDARSFTIKLIREVLKTTGITATAGIGSNIYLCKIAMDIVAKHMPADKDGVRIAELDEKTYRRLLWEHRPLTDFWRVGKGIASSLESHGLFTMGDIARCSIGKSTDFHNEDLLYRLFGINAELLIDHAWGWEPCTIADIKCCRPKSSSLSSGQVLPYPYKADDARLAAWEMADALSLDLVEKKLFTDQIVLTVVYDIENMEHPEIMSSYSGPFEKNYYGKIAPKSVRGTVNLDSYTSSSGEITNACIQLYDRIVNKLLFVRRIYISVNKLLSSDQLKSSKPQFEQLEMFRDYKAAEQEEKEREKKLADEIKEQQTIIEIKRRFGKNAIIKASSLQEGATARLRNSQVGGHKE